VKTMGGRWGSGKEGSRYAPHKFGLAFLLQA
jgi:hypothetical protein